MRAAVFCYDFPHRKSQDFILRLWLEAIPVVAVIGAHPVPLSRPASTLRVNPRYTGMLHPARICARLGIPYYVLEHSTPQAAAVIREQRVDLVLIGGARIIRGETLAAARWGMINFHPGLIPEVRGLDALKWSVYSDVPPGVTAHFIDARVDAGCIISRRRIPVFRDDAWIDLSLRLHETQVELLPTVLRRVADHPARDAYPAVPDGRVNRAMPPTMERVAAARFETWKARHARAEAEDDAGFGEPVAPRLADGP